ncbi:MAG: signal recognition particle-docking protein FtsY [Actinomycetes bacterium]
MDTLWIALAVLVVVVVAGVALVATRRRGPAPRPPATDHIPGVGDDASEPRDTPVRTVESVPLPDDGSGGPSTATLERPEASGTRMRRLRARLARSQSGLGRALLTALSRGHLDDSDWDDVEDTLISADLGVEASAALVERLRTRVKVEGVSTPDAVQALLRDELLDLVGRDTDRSLQVVGDAGRPAVVLIVGVNGTGKTTTTGKLARLLVAEDSDVLLGAADTFRAAASEQLQTWGDRVGVPVVRGPEGSDPASVAFNAVAAGVEQEVDVVIVDTAGRLHTKTGLMDELGKVKRVVEKQAPVTEVLLVLDATTGQNGLTQATVFAEVVQVTGIVLTKLDGTAKGGIVAAVQAALGVPVKLIGLGEGPDDLAPFDPGEFVDALLG